uniref:AfsR/SARP family transcriptional regulator n=1 Tax=Nonomuraea pusilla TaxID=46177 RepID=UPI0006E1C24A|nr:AfsR/SARP family transcriptional regulator [Nonomuraea pusilla]
MDFAVLGTVRVNGPGGRVRLSGRQRAVVSAFLLHPNTTISKDRLVAALWDSPPRSARANAATYVHQVRRALAGTGLKLRTEGSGYCSEVPPGQLDLLAFGGAVRRARLERARGDLEAAERGYAAAVALWRGRPAEDVPLGSELAPRIAELEERFAVARSEWIDVRLDLGHADLVAELRGLVAAHPLRERLWEQLMVALCRDGRRDEALTAFLRARALLVAELGIEPGPELRRLHAAILDGDDPALLPAPHPSTNLPAPQPAPHPSAILPAPHPSAILPATQPAPCPLPVVRASLCQLPPDTADFVGRADELRAALSLLRGPRDRPGPPVAVVSGLPGVGKTAFAVRLAHLLRSDYRDGQLFVRLDGLRSGARDPGELLGGLLRSLGFDGGLLPGPVEDRARLLRQHLADRSVLVVLDGARDEAQLRHLLPGTPRCAVLVTSRSPLPALEGAVRIELGPPGEDDARLLLERVAGRDRVRSAPRAAAEIVRACGGLPLAVRAAGARLAVRPAWPLREFAARLAGRGLDELAAGGLSVRAAFAASYRTLPAPAARAFRLLGLAGPDGVTVRSAAALLGVTELEADAALETLAAHGLLTSTQADGAGEPRYLLHRLLREYAGERAEAEEPVATRQEAVARHVRACLREIGTAERGHPTGRATRAAGERGQASGVRRTTGTSSQPASLAARRASPGEAASATAEPPATATQGPAAGSGTASAASSAGLDGGGVLSALHLRQTSHWATMSGPSTVSSGTDPPTVSSTAVETASNAAASPAAHAPARRPYALNATTGQSDSIRQSPSPIRAGLGP